MVKTPVLAWGIRLAVFGGCTAGYFNGDGTQCYKLHQESRSAIMAMLLCESEGATLVMPTSQTEHDFIVTLASVFNTGQFWIGITDNSLLGTTEGTYIYIDGDPLGAFEKWSASNINTGSNDCVYYASNGADLEWNTGHCLDDSRFFMCQLHDQTTEGAFVWGDGSTLASTGYTNWKADISTINDDLNDCVMIEKAASNQWSPTYCGSRMSFVCQAACPTGWRLHEGYGVCYLFAQQDDTFGDAVDKCSCSGARLFQPNIPSAQHFVLDIMATDGLQSSWVYLSDRETEGTFVWGDGTELVVTAENWFGGHPSVTNTEDRDCVNFARGADYKLKVQDCVSVKRHYACMRETTRQVTTIPTTINPSTTPPPVYAETTRQVTTIPTTINPSTTPPPVYAETTRQVTTIPTTVNPTTTPPPVHAETTRQVTTIPTTINPSTTPPPVYAETTRQVTTIPTTVNPTTTPPPVYAETTRQVTTIPTTVNPSTTPPPVYAETTRQVTTIPTTVNPSTTPPPVYAETTRQVTTIPTTINPSTTPPPVYAETTRQVTTIPTTINPSTTPPPVYAETTRQVTTIPTTINPSTTPPPVYAETTRQVTTIPTTINPSTTPPPVYAETTRQVTTIPTTINPNFIVIIIIRGDPHFTTIDNKDYTFNGLGEYTLVNALDGEFLVQGRTRKAIGSNGLETNATVLSAVAAKTSNSSSVQVNHEEGELRLYVDNIFTPEFNDLAAEEFLIFTDVMISKGANGSAVVEFTSGARLEVFEKAGIPASIIHLPNDYMGQTKGLMGVWNGDPDDDFTRPNGTILRTNATDEEIYDWGQLLNSSPVIDGPISLDVTVGEVVSFSFTATDLKGDPVTVAAETLPPGATFEYGGNTATVTWNVVDYDRPVMSFTATNARGQTTLYIPQVNLCKCQNGGDCDFGSLAAGEDPDGDLRVVECHCPPAYIGQFCEDFNECVAGTDDCGENAACVNDLGGYHCECEPGFYPNPGGKSCRNCPYGYRGYRGNCYRFYGGKNAQTYSGARQVCQENGGDIFMWRSGAAVARLKKKLKSDHSPSLWVGLSDEDLEGTFLWADGLALDGNGFTDWSWDQPHNTAEKDCVVARRVHRYRWKVVPCSYRRAFICQSSRAP
uniref:Uncharacterized protein n=1 Tax=Branchiostoma floridae TaxID=7739 RepID=C3Y5D6_BRAFL|eukprot:XP_002608173.1 hypothetical protein BRAFLDRAFT_90412 [Branchiostoma floridae]